MSCRVLHVIPAIAPRYGGPSVATLGMCRALSGVGIETLVVTTDADGPGRLAVELDAPQAYDGARVLFFRRGLSESFKWSGRLGAWLAAHVADYDVVHVHAVFSHSSLVAGRTCREAGVPYLVRPAGTLDPWSVRRKRLRKRILFRLGVDDLLAGASVMHYTSAEEWRLAETAVPGLSRGVVVPLGIDDALFARDAAPQSPPYVLSLSRLDEKKGLDLLIRAFAEVAADRHVSDWRLVIAGDGDRGYMARLRELARADKSGSRIDFTGWVSGQSKVDLLRGASLFALPSHQENFGISVVEAMACGVPVLVTPGVNLANDIETYGAGWVAARTPAAFSRALRATMDDAGARARRGESGRRLADQFRWPAVANHLRAVYEDVIRRHARGAPLAVSV
jgi:glycosyltransferase involved in cell wall biosynthesis